jgi:hypothetical protein
MVHRGCREDVELQDRLKAEGRIHNEVDYGEKHDLFNHCFEGARVMKRYRHVMMGCLVGGMMASMGPISTQLQAQSSPPVGMVVVEEMTVPDIGPLPTVVPIPGTNLNYAAKVELGKQLYP